MNPQSSDMLGRTFLRSVNLQIDLGEPENVAHFYPTTKNAQIINSICGLDSERVSIANAAYGSGKSLAATVSGLAVEAVPGSRDTLRAIAHRFSDGLGATRDFFRERASAQGTQGLVIALEGYVPDVVEGLTQGAATAFGRLGKPARTRSIKGAETIAKALGGIVSHAQGQGLDRVAIVWDEFGRHLEGLISDARADELASVQSLAESVARERAIPVTCTLILHQSFFNYTGHLNQTARNEWRKIEGRFRPIEYLDDSREMYELIGRVVAARSGAGEDLPPSAVTTARELLDHGFFGAFAEAGDLARVLGQTAPYDPAVVHILPRLAARVAQNERTLFDFLHASSDAERVTLADLYAFFAPAMRTDTSVGGTYRQWLEAESAIAKAQSTDEEDLIKATCLMTLGLSGSRFRVGVDALVAATAGGNAERRASVRISLDRLIERKLLLYRRHNDEVSVWHGTDADLRGRLDEEIGRFGPSFDLYGFLAKEWPAPTWRPVEYNSDFYVRRYFRGVYVDAPELVEKGFDHAACAISSGEDGRIVYALPRTTADIDALHALTLAMPEDPGLVLAIPRLPLRVFDAALEVACLTRLQFDQQLVASDPLVLPELRQMADDARVHLGHIMDRVVTPRPDGPVWVSGGESMQAATSAELRRELSQRMLWRFSKTPRINSEALVRTRLTRPMVNARKKLVLGILERSGEPDLRFLGTTPDASMYRAVLRNTGLYRERAPGVWRWAEPADLGDAGLREVWRALEVFFTDPSAAPKSPADLFERLVGQPFGLRPGVLPVLFAAGLKAFPSALNIVRDGDYLPDILPTDIEALSAEPARYRIDVYALGPERLAYLHGLLETFGAAGDPSGTELVRQCFDALQAWKRGLPNAAWNVRTLSAKANAFRELLRALRNPADVLFERIPAIASAAEGDYESLLGQVRAWRDELAGVSAVYVSRAAASLRSAVGCNGDEGDALSVVQDWVSRIPPNAVEGYPHELRAVLRIFRQAGEGGYEVPQFIDALSLVLVNKPLPDWDDAALSLFSKRLPPVLRGIEDAAIADGGAETVALVQDRVARLYDNLVRLVGQRGVDDYIAKLRETTVTEHGNTA
jgi:hypothetical protein